MKLKKLLSIFLAAIMIFNIGIVAVAAAPKTFTEGIFTYEPAGGKATLVKCDTSAKGKVVIPAMTQNGYAVDIVDSKAFENCSDITEIEIGENVLYVRYNPVPGCSSLARFSVNEKNKMFFADEYGVLYTADRKILEAYPGASEMENYVILDGVIRLNAAFDSCSNLKTLTIPESVEFRKYCAFTDCPRLTDIYFGGLEGEWLYMDGSAWETEENNITVHYRNKTIKEHFDHILNEIGLFSVITGYWGFYFVLMIPALPVLLVMELVEWVKTLI